jgi:transposase
MPAAYSNDLREKVMAALARGERPSQVARLFGISRNTLNLWRQRHARTGSWAAKTGYQHGHSAKLVDWEEFRRFAEAQGGQTLEAMARVRGVGRMTISRGLKKLGYTRKKRLTATKSGTKPNGSASSAISAHLIRHV